MKTFFVYDNCVWCLCFFIQMELCILKLAETKTLILNYILQINEIANKMYRYKKPPS